MGSTIANGRRYRLLGSPAQASVYMVEPLLGAAMTLVGFLRPARGRGWQVKPVTGDRWRSLAFERKRDAVLYLAQLWECRARDDGLRQADFAELEQWGETRVLADVLRRRPKKRKEP